MEKGNANSLNVLNYDQHVTKKIHVLLQSVRRK